MFWVDYAGLIALRNIPLLSSRRCALDLVLLVYSCNISGCSRGTLGHAFPGVSVFI